MNHAVGQAHAQLAQELHSIGQTLALHPIGSFLIVFDRQIQDGLNSALAGLSGYVGKPLIVCCALFCIWHGIKIANADGMPAHKLVPTFLKIAAIVWLATNLAAFDYYVRDIFYDGLPHALGMAVLGKSPSSTRAVGSAFDSIWRQAWIFAADVYKKAAWYDVADRISAELCVLGVSIALLLMAFVFLMARFLLAIVIAFGPVMIGCLLFNSTKPIFERWVGKMIALVALQVAVVITLNMLLVGDKALMRNIESTSGPLTIPTDIWNLTVMVLWFAFSALAMYALPAVAYSIGSGVQVHALAQAIGAGLGLSALRGGGGGAPQIPGQSGGQLPAGVGGLSLASNTMPRPQADAAGYLSGPPAEPPPPMHEGARWT